MNRYYLMIGIILIILVYTIFSMVKNSSFDNFNYSQYFIVLLLCLIGLIFTFKRSRSYNRKEPAEDELSKKIMQKASSVSYFISLYIWIFLMYIGDRNKMLPDEVIGLGMLCMAIILVIS